ncbi:double-strand-break repair protein rad21, putative, partial [Trypanosoma cruzi marinkellei]
RKTRSMNVLDLTATTVSGETVQRWMDDRSDIVDTIPRRGPYDVQEARDRATIMPESGKNDLWAFVDAAPLSWQPNPSLHAMYITLLKPFIEQAEASAMPPPLQQQQQQQQQKLQDENIPAGGMGEEEEEEEEMLAAAWNMEEVMQNINTHKRGREDEHDDENKSGRGGLSMFAMATLKRIRDEIEMPTQQQQQQQEQEQEEGKEKKK